MNQPWDFIPKYQCCKFCFQVPNAVNAKDQFNLSNDDYYSPKQMDNALRPNIGRSVIQVSKFLYTYIKRYVRYGPTLAENGSNIGLIYNHLVY